MQRRCQRRIGAGLENVITIISTQCRSLAPTLLRDEAQGLFTYRMQAVLTWTDIRHKRHFELKANAMSQALHLQEMATCNAL